MPNVWAIKTGNWSDTTVWNTGTLPTASDAVFANNFTVLINQNINVQSLNNFATGAIANNGGFTCFSSQTITASISSIAGSYATLLTITGSGVTVNISGSVRGPNGNVPILSLPNTLSNSTININGDVIGGGTNQGYTIQLSTTTPVTLNITGSVSGGTGTSARGLYLLNTTGSIINIRGNIVGNTGPAIDFQSTTLNNTCSIVGDVVTSGTTIAAAGTSNLFNITGSILAPQSSNQYGLNISSTTSTYNISGSITGGAVGINAYGINLRGTSNTVNLTGNSIGGISSTGGAYGILLAGTTNNLRVIGNVLGGISVSNNSGIAVTATAAYTASVFGDLITNIGSALVFNGASGVGTVNISGSVYAGFGLGINTANSTNFTLNITGSVYAGLSTNAYGINLANVATNSTVTVIGNVYSAPNTSYGVYNNSTAGTIIISGSVIASNAIGAYNNTTGTIIISGSAIAGVFVGAHNQSTGILKVISAVASTASAAINGVNIGGTTTYENATFASNGNVPWLGYVKMVSSSVNFISSSLEGTRYKMLIDRNNIAQGLPAVSDVRLGTSYNSGANIGTLAMPSASQVLSGIPVDNTTGSAVITTGSVSSAVWNTLVSTLGTSGSIGERARNIATVASVGDQLTALI